MTQPNSPRRRGSIPDMKCITKKPDAEDILLDAAAKYVRSIGGYVVVIGGIEIQEWPQDGKFSFRLAIKMSGTKPVRSERSGRKP